MKKNNKKNVIKRILVTLIIISVFMSFLPAGISAKAAQDSDKLIKSVVADVDKSFKKVDISYKINKVICPARSRKYVAQLCVIDYKYQILYSKNGKKLYKCDVEQKIREELDLSKSADINCYDMSQWDNRFYICFYANDYSHSVYQKNVVYYIAETKDFNTYKVYEMFSDTIDTYSIFSNGALPCLSKANGKFYYMYKMVSFELSDKEGDNKNGLTTFNVKKPIGYYGSSLDSLKELYFIDSLQYDMSEYAYGFDIDMYMVVEKSGIRLYVLQDFGNTGTYNRKTKYITEYFLSTGSTKEFGKLTQIAKNEYRDAYIGGYERFYTFCWADDDTYHATYGETGSEKRYNVNFPIEGDIKSEFDRIGKIVYGSVITAKTNINDQIKVKYCLLSAESNSGSYLINSKGVKTRILLPFVTDMYNPGYACANTNKGWSVVLEGDYFYLSADGFSTCRKIQLPCTKNEILDIEIYGNYLYALTSNALYKLPVQVSTLSAKSIKAEIKKLNQYADVKVEMGTYGGKKLQWDIVAVEDDKVLLLCSEKVDTRTFFSDDQLGKNLKELPVYDWGQSDVRKWLNGTLLKKFSDIEKDVIIPYHITTDTSEYDDMIFLLSEEEFEKYKKSITDIPDEWVLRDVNGYRGKTVIMNKTQDNVLYVYSVTEAVSDTDRIVRYHCEYNEEYAIRPAVWIKASAVSGGN